MSFVDNAQTLTFTHPTCGQSLQATMKSMFGLFLQTFHKLFQKHVKHLWSYVKLKIINLKIFRHKDN